ncbi:hypothetical protein E2C01_061357 [Portunus trituberculatus]|uniref:Uncharacterized protein n=1 Tax=Portunus trituberculatus TaxID=210409 RepID=A0A5B7HBG0_PORTR|nr:hypothetical protein [Portunus trituberculatus]
MQGQGLGRGGGFGTPVGGGRAGRTSAVQAVRDGRPGGVLLPGAHCYPLRQLGPNSAPTQLFTWPMVAPRPSPTHS